MVNSGRSFYKYACAVGKSTLKMRFRFFYPYGRRRCVWDLTELAKRIQPKFSSSLVKIHDRCTTCPMKQGWHLELRPNNSNPGNSSLALTWTKTDFPGFAWHFFVILLLQTRTLDNSIVSKAKLFFIPLGHLLHKFIPSDLNYDLLSWQSGAGRSQELSKVGHTVSKLECSPDCNVDLHHFRHFCNFFA